MCDLGFDRHLAAAIDQSHVCDLAVIISPFDDVERFIPEHWTAEADTDVGFMGWTVAQTEWRHEGAHAHQPTGDRRAIAELPGGLDKCYPRVL